MGTHFTMGTFSKKIFTLSKKKSELDVIDYKIATRIPIIFKIKSANSVTEEEEFEFSSLYEIMLNVSISSSNLFIIKLLPNAKYVFEKAIHNKIFSHFHNFVNYFGSYT